MREKVADVVADFMNNLEKGDFSKFYPIGLFHCFSTNYK
jgi:hypothetical protein